MNYSESLKKNKDFRFVYENGKSYANKYLVMYVLRNGSNRNRIGISVSKKVGNSVVRHRLTRLIREAYRLNEDLYDQGLDMIFVVRANGKDIGFHQMASAMAHVSNIHKVLKRRDKNENN